MKALKSDLARRVLADPTARAQLRDANSGGWVMARDSTGRIAATAGRTISLRDSSGRVMHLTPTAVPKAG